MQPHTRGWDFLQMNVQNTWGPDQLACWKWNLNKIITHVIVFMVEIWGLASFMSISQFPSAIKYSFGIELLKYPQILSFFQWEISKGHYLQLTWRRKDVSTMAIMISHGKPQDLSPFQVAFQLERSCYNDLFNCSIMCFCNFGSTFNNNALFPAISKSFPVVWSLEADWCK